MASGHATVKAVPSGDTIVLVGNATSGPPPELQITLSSLNAPRLGRQGGSPDEPYAWGSREFLRSMCIGKTVRFQVEYRVAAINRDFGQVWLDGRPLGAAVARAGWARVKPAEQSRDGQAADYEDLVAAERAAQAECAGLWAAAEGDSEACPAVRPMVWGDFDAQALLNEALGLPQKCVVEHVRDGGALRVLLAGPRWAALNLMLAGLQCPRVNAAPRDGQAAAAAPEPHAGEARFFTESRLLHREVDVLLQGVDKFGNFYGTVLHPAGNISVELLRQGLARVVDWSAVFCRREDAVAMRAAERQAKLAKLRLWRDWTPPQLTTDSELIGTVIEVVSGDMIVVKLGDDPLAGEEKRVSISSVRTPRLGNARRNAPDEPWAAEAKDFLRTRLIGREVTVSVEYERDMPTGAPEDNQTVKRPFGTVTVGKGAKARNVGAALVEAGLATVVRHRQGEERSLHYDDLLQAEQAAIAARRGLHKGESPPPVRVTDLTQNKKQALQYLPFLQRQQTVKAYVDYVFAGSRFKVFIPKENCAVMFALTAVRAPQPGRTAGPDGRGARRGDPSGDAARDFSRLRLMQRNVEIAVTDMDRNGVALGTLLVGQGEARHDYALDLLEAGLARLDDRAAERMGGAELAAMEDKQAAAAANKIGLWAAVGEEEEEEAARAAREGGGAGAAGEEMTTVRVADIADGGNLYLHVAGDDGLARVGAGLARLAAEHGTGGAPCALKRGALVAALFDDGAGGGPAWFRARVAALDSKAKTAQVVYIDHGNRAAVPFSRTRPLPPELAAAPPAARDARLAGVKAPAVHEDFGRDAGMLLSELAWGRELICRAYGRCPETGQLRVVLHDGEVPASVNEGLISAGVCRINKKEMAQIQKQFPTSSEFFDALKASQEMAKKSRANMWRYGDVESDDEEPYYNR